MTCSTANLPIDRSLETLPSEALKIGRNTSSLLAVSGRSQPMPMVPEKVFQRVGMERDSAPLVATKVGS
ncbi:hypothetical protein D3C72_1774410 [compost metagenome]